MNGHQKMKHLRTTRDIGFYLAENAISEVAYLLRLEIEQMPDGDAKSAYTLLEQKVGAFKATLDQVSDSHGKTRLKAKKELGL